jgi:hypothetical protein
MKYIPTIFLSTLVFLMTNCSNKNQEEKGFQLYPTTNDPDDNQADGLNRDSLTIDTQPGNVLLTGIPSIRLTTIYKVNVNKKNNATFIGSNHFYYSYEEPDRNSGNNWNNHLMPGLEAVYGYNLVNVSHYDIKAHKQKTFFEKPVLVRTLYYPSFSKDTLQHKPVSRDYFIISVHNEDTNKDNFINLKDLRRLYLFNINGEKQKALIPENYSVFKSDYDPDNDLMYVFAKLDQNDNGQPDEGEPIHIFWIDLKDPQKTGRQY